MTAIAVRARQRLDGNTLVRACTRSSTASRSASATEQLVATAHRRADDPAWSERDARLVRFADELQDTCGVSDGVWSALAELYRDDQMLELVISVGWYRLVSYVINAVRIASPGQRGSRPDDGRGRAGVNAPRPGPGERKSPPRAMDFQRRAYPD